MVSGISRIAVVVCFAAFLVGASYAEAASAVIRIRNTRSNLCLEVRDGSTASGAILQQNTCNGKDHQTFYVANQYDGSIILKNKRSLLCVDVKDITKVSGSLVQQSPCKAEPRQMFTGLFRRSGVYSMVSQLNAACFHIRYGSTSPGALLQTGRCNLTTAQDFKFEILSGSLPFIVSMPPEVPKAPPSGPSLRPGFYGVNLSGGEAGSSTKNTYGWDYMYPKDTYINYFAARGFTTIRVPFKIRRIQKTLSGGLDTTELSRLDAVIAYARSKGLYVILDPHDYGKMRHDNGSTYLIGTKEIPAYRFANFWARMARVYSKYPNVIFNIMNEPNAQKPEQWQSSAILAVNAIRSVGANQLIMIPGTAWTGASRWISTGNARVWTNFKDKNYAFDVHQYLDYDNSGTHDTCSLDAGAKRLIPFRDWARTYKHRGFIGEMGWSTKSSCLVEGKDLLTVFHGSRDVFMGYAYWGAAWANNFLTLNPADGNIKNLDPSLGKDRPQTTQLMSFFGK